MIKFENIEVTGWEAAIRGMRNPMNSWDKSDSRFVLDYSSDEEIGDRYIDNNIGPNDIALMRKLAAGGSVHAKYRRMILVTMDITAPLYWWKEYDTYKVGTVANSCSTMHKIQAKEFTIDDFSHEHLSELAEKCLMETIRMLNMARKGFIGQKDKCYWWDMIQLLPTSYNQKRTVLLNYEILSGIHPSRNGHKLDEWQEFTKMIESLPYAADIICPNVFEINTFGDGKMVHTERG